MLNQFWYLLIPIVIGVLAGSVIRLNKQAHYDYLVDTAIPKMQGKWYSTDVIHKYTKARDVDSEKQGVLWALDRLEKKGLVKSDWDARNNVIYWQWVGET